MLENLSQYQDEPLVKFAIQICRWHHERWDGSGYPDGRKGDDIPIAAQVVALADAYDGLVGKRDKHEALSQEEAVAELTAGKRGAFNPLLLECLQEIATGWQKHSVHRKNKHYNKVHGDAPRRLLLR